MAGNLGHLAATVSLNIDPFRASARTLSSTIKATTAELKAQDIAFKGSEKSVGSMRTVYGTLERQMQQYEAKLKREQKTLAKRSKAVQEGNGDMEKLTTREANAASAVNKTAAQIALLNNRMAAMRKEILLQSNGWTQMSQKAAAFSKVTGKVGSSLASFGSKATMAVTAPIAAGFTAAAKSAIDFNSQIDAIGPLMTNGAAVTGKYRTQLDQLASSSKKWAVQYGISTTSINNGLADLVRAGYSAGQSMKMMPAILDASRASGEDFNGVMEVVTSTMTQFGVKAANTTSVTDAMTYAANATKSGFSDMGEAMQYTGQSAHAAGVSLTETVADIGLLSNAGLQGSTAGTAFNMMLQKLAAASTKADSPMAKLGVNIKAFKDGQIGLPEVIEQVTKATEGKNKVDKVAAVNAAFGERGGRAVLALLNAGAPAMRKLTQETSNAAGATKKVSDMMGNTAAANFNKLKSSVQVLGIEVGENLLPAITPLVAKATEMVQAFGKLDKSTQQSIIKFTLFAAAAGPVSSALGGMFKIISGGAGAFSAVAGGIGRAQTAAKIGASGFDVLKSTFSETAFKALSAAPAIAETGEAATGAAAGGSALLTSLAPLGVALVGVAGAAAVGYGVWKIWGEKAYESSQRTKRWGTDIGEAADKSATKMKQASGEISGALDNTNQSAKTNSKQIVDGFNSMAQAAKQAADQSDAAAKKLAKSLGGDAADALLAAAAKEKTANDKRVKQVQENAAKVKAITKSAGEEQGKLTADQLQVIKNLQQDSAIDAVKTLRLSGQQQNNVTKAILGERVTMSATAAKKQYTDSVSAMEQEYETTAKKRKAINDNDKLSTTEKNATIEGLERDHKSKMDAIYLSMVQALKAQGMSNKEVQAQLQQDMGMTAEQAEAAMNRYKKAMNGGVTSTKQFAASVNKNMSANVKKAGNDWNSLVLDPKTGKVVTNLPEVLQQTASTKEGWKRLTFDLKYAKISSNAKENLLAAMIQTDKWNKMTVQHKYALLTTAGKQDLADIIDQLDLWNQLNPKQMAAVVKGDSSSLVAAIDKVQLWDQMSPSQLELIVHDKASATIITALQKSGQWNALPLAEKEAIVNAKGAAQVAQLSLQYGTFNSLPDATKKAALNDKDFVDKVGADALKYHNFYTLPDSVKQALMKNEDLRQKLVDSGQLINDYNLNYNPKKKVAKADTANVQNNFGLGKKSILDYKGTNPGPTKVGKGDTSSAVNGFRNAKGAIDKFRVSSPGSPKHAKAVDGASGPAGKATEAVGAFQRKPNTISKMLSVGISFAKGVGKILGLKKGTNNFVGGLAMVNDAPGSVYREAITLPNGQTFIPKERNAILPLPRHAKIATAISTARQFAVPRFASGTTDFTGAATTLQNLRPQTVQTVNVTASNENDLGDALRTLNVLVAELLDYKPSISGTVQLDNGREVGRWSAEGVQEQINRMTRTNNRRKGYN
ncbi:phage tail tape measure protein [Lacticaseibacillus suilingensis]|uniref:Phage tail tape measure protein n=1 Tax=Lacticaseibacillus suilingensis TaxID=2799577 RepID=A0ABW4BDI5_9LACO|nr:phage tail tape measure protein [Lacticaseibacillus suilingensis]